MARVRTFAAALRGALRLPVAAAVFAALAAALLLPPTAGARDEVCPRFELPWLTGEGTATAAGLIAGQRFTVLVFWNRECPHCTAVALDVDEFAGVAADYDARVVPVLFGPDDPTSLAFLLEERGVQTRHLWDETGRTAAAYGVGTDHLLVVLADRGAAVIETFDSSISDLTVDVGPALARAHDTHPDVPALAADSPASASPAMDLPSLRSDGRFRFQSTEGANPGDTGLYGEPLTNGAFSLFRWDLKLTWSPVKGITFIPWLRLSNEDERVLTEGAEQFSNRYGTATLRGQAGAWTGIIGAFPLHLSPLLLQRWDREDAPPLGGVAGCSICGAGVAGVSQRSLEILDSDYTFEGIYAAASSRWVKGKAWGAVARWERQHPRFSGISAQDSLDARYRRTLVGASVDVGPAGSEDAVFGLPTPFGLRVSYLSAGDDRRTVPPEYIRPPEERDEHGWMAMGQLGPWYGLAAEAEYVWWYRWSAEDDGGAVHSGDTHAAREINARAYRAGLRGRWQAGRVSPWAKVHRLWSQPGFAPLYAALTYEANQEGWRAAGGLDLYDRPGAGRERGSVSFFLRDTGETDPAAAIFEQSWKVTSLSVTWRPVSDLLAGAYWVRTVRGIAGTFGGREIPDDVSNGYSLDLRWEGWSTLDPYLRLDAIHRDDGWDEPHTIWQGYLFVRVIV